MTPNDVEARVRPAACEPSKMVLECHTGQNMNADGDGSSGFPVLGSKKAMSSGRPPAGAPAGSVPSVQKLRMPCLRPAGKAATGGDHVNTQSHLFNACAGG